MTESAWQKLPEALDPLMLESIITRMKIGYRDDGYFDKDARRLYALVEWLKHNHLASAAPENDKASAEQASAGQPSESELQSLRCVEAILGQIENLEAVDEPVLRSWVETLAAKAVNTIRGARRQRDEVRSQLEAAERAKKIARHEWQLAQDKLAEIERNLIRITGIETDYMSNIDTLAETQGIAGELAARLQVLVDHVEWIARESYLEDADVDPDLFDVAYEDADHEQWLLVQESRTVLNSAKAAGISPLPPEGPQ